MVLFAENTNKTLRALSLFYIKDEEFLINTVFLLFLGLKPFFAGILAHGVNHVVDAGDFREIVPGWISRTFRDVERLDDSVVDVHGETLGSPRTKLGARSWVRQFDAQVFNHNGVRVTHERNDRARNTLCLSPRIHDLRVVGTENDHLIDPSALQFILSGNITRNLTRGSCRCESTCLSNIMRKIVSVSERSVYVFIIYNNNRKDEENNSQRTNPRNAADRSRCYLIFGEERKQRRTWKADQDDLFAFASFSHVDWCWHAIDPRTELQYATDLISNFSTHCARR